MRSAPEAIARAFSFGQPCNGLTNRKRDSPKLAMARAAAPMRIVSLAPSVTETLFALGAAAGRDRFVSAGTTQ